MSVNNEAVSKLPKGVRRLPSGPNPFTATITISGRPIYLGVFPTMEMAGNAMKAAAAARKTILAEQKAARDAARDEAAAALRNWFTAHKASA